MQSKSKQNAVTIQSKYSQNSVKIQSKDSEINLIFYVLVARTRELEAENEDLKKQMTGKNEENENLARQLEDMHSSYSQARQKSVALEESNDK